MRDHFAAIVRQVERQAAAINRIMRQRRDVERQAAAINRIMRQRRDVRRMIAGRQNVAPGERLVRVTCRACGAKAGTVEWDAERRRLISVTGGRRYSSPTRHRCAQCGWLRLDYDDVQAKALQAVDERHIVPLRAKPLSTP